MWTEFCLVQRQMATIGIRLMYFPIGIFTQIVFINDIAQLKHRDAWWLHCWMNWAKVVNAIKASKVMQIKASNLLPGKKEHQQAEQIPLLLIQPAQCYLIQILCLII